MTNTVGLTGFPLAFSNWRPPARRVLIRAPDDLAESVKTRGPDIRPSWLPLSSAVDPRSSRRFGTSGRIHVPFFHTVLAKDCSVGSQET